MLRSLTLGFQAFLVWHWHKQFFITACFRMTRRSWSLWSVLFPRMLYTVTCWHAAGRLRFVRFLCCMRQLYVTIIRNITDTFHVYLFCCVAWNAVIIGEHHLPSTYRLISIAACVGHTFSNHFTCSGTLVCLRIPLTVYSLPDVIFHW